MAELLRPLPQVEIVAVVGKDTGQRSRGPPWLDATVLSSLLTRPQGGACTQHGCTWEVQL